MLLLVPFLRCHCIICKSQTLDEMSSLCSAPPPFGSEMLTAFLRKVKEKHGRQSAGMGKVGVGQKMPSHGCKEPDVTHVA